jgi:hypothetical protein
MTEKDLDEAKLLAGRMSLEEVRAVRRSLSLTLCWRLRDADQFNLEAVC